jgi:hypothetical protein
MATDIGGLFQTPEQYQQALQQQAYDRASAMEQAPWGTAQRIAANVGGYQLGGIIGRALGGEDSQLKLISQRQQLASQLDPTNLDSYKLVAQDAANRGDTQFAMAVADAGRQAAIQVAQANKERKLSIAPKIQEVQFASELQDQLAQISNLPPSPERDRAISNIKTQLQFLTPEKVAPVAQPLQVANRITAIRQQLRNLDPNSVEAQDLQDEITQLQRPEKPEPRISVGSDAERISLELFNKPYGDLQQSERVSVNKRVETEAAAKVPKIQVDLKDPTAVAKANLDVMGKWEGFLKSGGDVEVANRFKAVQSAVAMAASGNPSADGALLYNIAKMYDPSGAVQEGDKKSVTGNPSIPTRFKLLVQGVLEGGSFTPQQRKDLQNIASEIVKNRESQLNVYRKQYVGKVKTLGGTEEDILNPYQNLIKAPMSDFIMQSPNTNPQNLTGGKR